MAARQRNKEKRFPGRPGAAQKVYIETRVWGMILDNQPRALREPTKKFLH